MSVSVTLKDWLIDKIEALSSVQAVYGYEPQQFSGYPAVTVTMPTMEGQFSSNVEDQRIYGFRVQVFVPLGQDLEKPKTMTRELYAENVVSTVIEGIINAIDTDFDATAVSQSNNIISKFIEATDFIPFYVNIEGGEHRGAEITVRFVTEKIVQ